MHACLSKPADFLVARDFLPRIQIIPVVRPSAYMRALINSMYLNCAGALIGGSANPNYWEITKPSLPEEEFPTGHKIYLKQYFIAYGSEIPENPFLLKRIPVLRDALRAGLTLDRIRAFEHKGGPKHVIAI